MAMDLAFYYYNFTMLILFETAAGYALFRADKPKKLEKVENLQKYINDVDGLRKLYK